MQELPGDELFGLQAGSLLSGGRAACPRNAMASLKPSRAADLGIVPLSWRAESAATPNRRFKRRSAITSQARVFSVVKSILGLILLSAPADRKTIKRRTNEYQKEARRTPEGSGLTKIGQGDSESAFSALNAVESVEAQPQSTRMIAGIAITVSTIKGSSKSPFRRRMRTAARMLREFWKRSWDKGLLRKAKEGP